MALLKCHFRVLSVVLAPICYEGAKRLPAPVGAYFLGKLSLSSTMRLKVFSCLVSLQK